jgi:hypothetical protein
MTVPVSGNYQILHDTEDGFKYYSILHFNVTTSLDHIPYLEADSRSATLEIPFSLRNHKVHYRTHKTRHYNVIIM